MQTIEDGAANLIAFGAKSKMMILYQLWRLSTKSEIISEYLKAPKKESGYVL